MKKVFKFLFAGMLIFAASCAGETKSTSTEATAAQPAEAYETEINIRYVNQDSIQKNYVFAEEIAQKTQQIQMELMAYTNNLQTQLQNMQSTFQQKYQNNGYINESAAQADYNNIQQKAANYDKLLAQRQAQAQEQALAYAKALSDSIQNFIEAYNKEHKYDAILIQESVLYINPALDITQEVVDGLNARYKPVVTTTDKKEEPKAADKK